MILGPEEKTKPAAFLSYSRSDDRYHHITEFRRRLSDEVAIQTGEPFCIFQDRDDIQWGENWKSRIEQSLAAVTFLIPVITPSYFKSEACRGELEMFLEHEKRMKRGDLILPVYYVDCPLMNDEKNRRQDRLAQLIAARQFVDWRELRFVDFDSSEVARRLAGLAVQIREALDSRRAWEPPTLTVAPAFQGDYLTVGEAVEAANPGDRILIRPGTYRESIVLRKALQLVGEGNTGLVVIEATNYPALLSLAEGGSVRNLSLRNLGDESYFAVDISHGNLDLMECDITSQNGHGVGIHEDAKPSVRRNSIHHCKHEGIFAQSNAGGLFEGNDIFRNAGSGVVVSRDAEPQFLGNRIHHNRKSGVYVWGEAGGRFEENEIFSNSVGVTVTWKSKSSFLRNRISRNRWEAVQIWNEGAGHFEDNDLRNNGTGAWRIDGEAHPNLTRLRNQE